MIDASSRGCRGDDHEVKICGDAECPEEKTPGNTTHTGNNFIFEEFLS
jgi:hypothetical protein